MSKLQDNRYDLVVTDCQMPEMDGYEATGTVRATGDKTPIIGLSSIVKDKDREKGLDRGMNDLLEKPLTIEILEDLIKQYPPHDN